MACCSNIGVCSSHVQTVVHTVTVCLWKNTYTMHRWNHVLTLECAKFVSLIFGRQRAPYSHEFRNSLDLMFPCLRFHSACHYWTFVFQNDWAVLPRRKTRKIHRPYGISGRHRGRPGKHLRICTCGSLSLRKLLIENDIPNYLLWLHCDFMEWFIVLQTAGRFQVSTFYTYTSVLISVCCLCYEMYVICMAGLLF